jgi:hypothetical protein
VSDHSCDRFISQSLAGIVVQTATSGEMVSPTTGINYTRLKNFLAQQNWRQANDETRNLMLKATGRELQGWFTMEDLQKLACWEFCKRWINSGKKLPEDVLVSVPNFAFLSRQVIDRGA